MTDLNNPIAPKSSKMNATPTAVNPNPLGLDLGEFKLTSEVCKSQNKNASLVQGLDFYLFDQCSDTMNTPLLSLDCENQSKDGITWDLKAETGEIATNCPNSTRYFLKKETMTIEVGISAIALANEEIMGFLEGRRTSANGNMRAYGYGGIKTYTIVLVDRESMTAAIYPNCQYVPSSIQIKKVYDSEPSSKIMFQVSKADIGDGESFFYEVRSIAPSNTSIVAPKY